LARLIWSVDSRDNLRSIHRRISKDSERAADALIDQIISSVGRLSEFPLSGRIVPEFNQEDIRELIVRSYRVVYQVIGDSVGIVRVHHGARLLRRSDIELD
jgi:toxin ParE1/3/4